MPEMQAPGGDAWAYPGCIHAGDGGRFLRQACKSVAAASIACVCGLWNPRHTPPRDERKGRESNDETLRDSAVGRRLDKLGPRGRVYLLCRDGYGGQFLGGRLLV